MDSWTSQGATMAEPSSETAVDVAGSCCGWLGRPWSGVGVAVRKRCCHSDSARFNRPCVPDGCRTLDAVTTCKLKNLAKELSTLFMPDPLCNAPCYTTDVDQTAGALAAAEFLPPRGGLLWN